MFLFNFASLFEPFGWILTKNQKALQNYNN